MKYAALIFGGLILALFLCLAEGGKKLKPEHWVIDGALAEWASDSTDLGLMTNLPIRARDKIKVTSTPTGTVVEASMGDVTNHYRWIPADYLYTCPTETLTNSNGGAVFTKHEKTKTEYAGPISCPAPMGYTSNVTFQWFTYHSKTGTYGAALGATTAAALPDSESLDAIGRWPLVAVLGAFCCFCVWIIYCQGCQFGKRLDKLSDAIMKLAANLKERPCIRH